MNAGSISRRLAMAVVIGCLIPAVSAAPGSGQFLVTATFVPANAPSASGFCTSGPGRSTFGAVVTIVCDTGAVVDIEAPRTALPWTSLHGSAYRYSHTAENEFRGSRLTDGIESYTGVGTITSWRLVSLADRDYLEVQIGW